MYQQQKDIYITESLKAIVSNTAHSAIKNGIIVKKSFYDIIKPKKEETRSAEEIINKIKKEVNGE